MFGNLMNVKILIKGKIPINLTNIKRLGFNINGRYMGTRTHSCKEILYKG